MMDDLMDRIRREVEGRVWRVTSETEAQTELARVLSGAGLAVESEVRLGAGSRVDLLVEGRLVVEVKRAGSMPSLAAQCLRYAELDGVEGVVAVVTRRRLLFPPKHLDGVPIQCALMRGW
jgi:hypothetical protein